MVASLPESVDAWRMVSARRSFAGCLPVAGLSRLCEALADATGDIRYALDFGRDDQQVCYVDVRADVVVQLMCQRTLQPFALPLAVNTRLGMLRSEHEEAGLPADVEPLLIPCDAWINPADVIEDELLLALPLVAINPDAGISDVNTSSDVGPSAGDAKENPFAVLRELKK